MQPCSPFRLPVWLTSAWCASLSLASSAAQGSSCAPFEPGQRWQQSATLAQTWIPRGLDFAADGEFLLSAQSGQSPGLSLRSSAAQAGGSVLVGQAFPGALGALQVVAGDAPSKLFALAQYAAPTSSSKQTLVSRHDALAALGSGASSAAPQWTLDLGLCGTGNALLCANSDASLLCAVVYDSTQHKLRVSWIAPADGHVQQQLELSAGGLRRIELAQGGELAISAGLDLYVLAPSGTLLHHEVLAAASDALAFSADATTLAIGGYGALRVLRQVAGTGAYALDFTISAPASELATRAALCDQGATLAVGWWNFQSGTALRFECWDTLSRERLQLVEQGGASTGLQDFPEAVVVSADGQRFGFGAWGLGSSEPEAWLFERGSSAPLFAVDLAGSVQALALDAHGTRLGVAHKNTHANLFGATGSVRLYDTGERDLQVLQPALLGAQLLCSAKQPDAAALLFVLGQPTAAWSLAGLEGQAWIDAAQPHWLLGVKPDAEGVATLSLPVPLDSTLLGLPLQAQALFAAPNGLRFGTSLAPLWIL